MSDFSRDRFDGDEDRLPWLEAVEEEDERRGAGAGRLIAAVIAGLIALGLVIGGVFWLRDRNAGGPAASTDLIAAPQGAYKEKPSEPGGMQVQGTGDVVYPASEGADINSAIDLTALPEAPIAGRGGAPAPAAVAPVKSVPLPASTVAPAKPAPTKLAEAKIPATTPPAPVAAKPAPPKPQIAAANVADCCTAIQLGAFSSEAKANAVWKTLSRRFAFLTTLTSSVTPVKTGGGTLYRLRASGGDVAGACAKLKVAGETCSMVE